IRPVRRNRLTGRIGLIDDDGFTIEVDQAFGNCPQYIQSRTIEPRAENRGAEGADVVIRAERFDSRTREMIAGADTLFIATAHTSAPDQAARNPTLGVDVSHRGGRPGFVRLEDERTFTLPDFAGNNHFNTVGNLLLNPRAGFLFVDFETGDLAYMTGTVEIVWEGEEVRAFAGAERLIRFQAEEVIRAPSALPLRFAFQSYSPMLEHTGDWTRAIARLAAERERDVYRAYEVFAVAPESETVTSFSLRRADGKALAGFEPGQFLPIRLELPGRDGPVIRTYSLSNAADSDHYRLSIKREGGGALVSNFLHDHATPGFHIEAIAPRGDFVLDCSSERPVVLLSAGIGVTPMIAMAETLVQEAKRTRRTRAVFFIHGARNGRNDPFGARLRHLADEHSFLNVHIRYSQPLADDRLGESHDSEGHVDLALIKSVLPLDDYDVYLCGPAGFMQTLYDGLRTLGVAADRIRYESFGPATVLTSGRAKPEDTAGGEPVVVRFRRSEIEAAWSPDQGTLLDFAEAQGLNPPFACRSGVCGSCSTRVACGEVDYLEPPLGPHADDEALLCRSTPAPSSACGGAGLVLDL
ncbi:MAG: FAD-binding oxidoreductase, partial [Geminicoccaceae bacterium]|nr:FAD-binding oxidoreductase [Geminicoccaceae bacterium]